jgi:NAD(P)-dependent dehydrogenase (short-subunit alcohol dehydrogenase family)
MKTVLVVGGYGGFGARLCRRLSETGNALLVAGRNGTKASRFAAKLAGARPLVLDRNDDIGPILARERPDLVVDAAGPFQASGYGVVEACLRAGIPYLDLADARGFVCGISGMDAQARAAGIPVVSGASTAPALTGAVVRKLAEGLDRVHQVDIALSAANRPDGGESVLAAVLSYAGRPVRLRRGGRWTAVPGWQEMRRTDFLFGDGSGLRGRLVAVADLPECTLLPDLLPGRPAVTFRAGTELGFQMRALWVLSWLVRWGWPSSLSGALGWIMPLYRLTARIGGKRSAMSITLTGRRDDAFVERRWTIVAEEGKGLEIPTLAAELIASDILAGRLPAGAYTPASLLSLDRFEPLLARLPVRVEISETVLPPPLYARAMGAAFEALPPAVRGLHDFRRDSGAAGEAVVVRGRGLVPRLLAWLMRFPPEGRRPLHVSFAERDGVETWTRDYGGHVMRSELSKASGGVTERFGPIRFAFDLVPRPDGLAMNLVGWSLLRVPLPRFLGPRIAATEREQDGRFHFDVSAALPLLGEVVRYAGWLEPLA